MRFIRVIWAHYLNKKEAEKIVDAGFDAVIAISWDYQTYEYFKSHGVKLYRWVRNLEKFDNYTCRFFECYSNGLVLDPESWRISKEAKEYYCNYICRIFPKECIVGTATWAIAFPVFKKELNYFINWLYGLEIKKDYIKIFGEIYYVEFLFPMCYAGIGFLADERVKWMLEGWADIRKEIDIKVIPILQAFSHKELGEWNIEFKPSKEQLEKWTEWVESLGFYGVSYFCWDTYKKDYL